MAGFTLQPVAVHQLVDLHVPNQRLDHGAPAQPDPPPAALCACITALARQVDFGARLGRMAPIAHVRHRGLN